jgi:hypothetical protein
MTDELAGIFRAGLAASHRPGPATEADVDQAVNSISRNLRQRHISEPGLEDELRQVGQKYLTQHPDGTYWQLYAALRDYVSAEVYDGPLADPFAGMRPTGAKALRASSEGAGGRA